MEFDDINDFIKYVITHDSDGSPRGTNPPPTPEPEKVCNRCGMPLHYNSCDCSPNYNEYGRLEGWSS